MGRRKDLTLEERRKILQLYESGLTVRFISKVAGRSETAVRNSLKEKKYRADERSRRNCGRPKLLTEKKRKLIIFLAQTRLYTIREIQQQLPFKVSRSTVHRTIKQDLTTEAATTTTATSIWYNPQVREFSVTMAIFHDHPFHGIFPFFHPLPTA